MRKITADNIHEYLLAGESDTIEFKLGIIQKRDIERMVSAFANTKGGVVVFGYDEREKTIVGVTEDEVKRLKFMCDEMQYENLCSFYTIEKNGMLIAILDIQKSKKDIFIDNVAYIRKGDKIFSKISNIRSKYLQEFVREIQYHNRNPQNIDVLKLLEDLSTNPERRINKGTNLYRCRIIEDVAKIGKELNFFGYGKKDSFVPPAKATRDLRANYRYIPYLYCANHPYTALVEVRPRLGAGVSVATIKVTNDLLLLDFTLKNIPKKITEAKLKLFSDLSMMYSKPVTVEDDILDYIPTQFVAEFAKNLGYDGIVFRSSLTPELEGHENSEPQDLDRYNIVVFNYQKCEPVASNVVMVTRNYLECEQVDDDLRRIDVHTTILDMSY